MRLSALSSRVKLYAAFFLLIIVAAAVVFAVTRDNAPGVSFVPTRTAEAVAVTAINPLDGIWDARRYSDELYYPVGLALKNGDVIIADSMADRIVIIDSERSWRVGRPGQYGLAYSDAGALVDGYREHAMFMKPTGVAVAQSGDIIIADSGNNVIRKMDNEFVVTIAGSGLSGYADGREGGVMFNSPRGVAAGADGIIYVADTMNHCIRSIDTNGNVTLYAGVPETSGYADGALTDALFFEPSGIAVSPSGEIYIADSGNHCIRLIKDGIVSTFAGTPGEVDRVTGYPAGGYADGDIKDALFNFPRGIALMPGGGVIVADTMNHAVRLIDQGRVITLAGSGEAGVSHDSAENIRLTRPEGVATDGDTLYISDTVNNRVLSVPLTDRVIKGRPSREEMLKNSGVSLASKYSYSGDIRVYIGDTRIDMGRVAPWNTDEYLYMPIRPLFEALGAEVNIDEDTLLLTVTIDGLNTYLELDKDYFIMKGAAVTTTDEIIRLFPYIFEWYPEYSLVILYIPEDLKGE